MYNGVIIMQCVTIITPHACARGKAIGFFCLSSIVCRPKIPRSWILGICACCNYHGLVDSGEKLVSVCFKLLNMVHLALHIVHFPLSIPVVYRLHPPHVLTWLSCTCSTSCSMQVYKGCQVMKWIQLQVCELRIAKHGSLALQIVHFQFSMPVVYWLHPLYVLTWLNCTC